MSGPNHIHKLKLAHAGNLDTLQRAVAVHLHGGPIDNLDTQDLKRILARARKTIQDN